MSRLLDVLYAYLKQKAVTQEEFIHQLVANDYGDERTARAFMAGETEPCVAIVRAAQEILGLTNDEAAQIRAAGMEDAKEHLGSLQRV